MATGDCAAGQEAVLCPGHADSGGAMKKVLEAELDNCKDLNSDLSQCYCEVDKYCQENVKLLEEVKTLKEVRNIDSQKKKVTEPDEIDVSSAVMMIFQMMIQIIKKWQVFMLNRR